MHKRIFTITFPVALDLWAECGHTAARRIDMEGHPDKPSRLEHDVVDTVV